MLYKNQNLSHVTSWHCLKPLKYISRALVNLETQYCVKNLSGDPNWNWEAHSILIREFLGSKFPAVNREGVKIHEIQNNFETIGYWNQLHKKLILIIKLFNSNVWFYKFSFPETRKIFIVHPFSLRFFRRLVRQTKIYSAYTRLD